MLTGLSPALKHYTSKLATYDDLSTLTTFGFRGEALSSLCALADFSIITAQEGQAPKATKLDFETSGKLKKTSVVAGQKGTTATVGALFSRLPVRRKELEKNIKREYGKVLNLLHAYACISTGVRFNVRNTVGKAKNVIVFSTKANTTTKENIANVYGAKMLSSLIPLELELEFEPSAAGRRLGRELNKIRVNGHVSRPVVGEGRQAPDRQMFFVNSRPCGLPQIAKAFNEVYKSFNVTQSPFVFADFQMDTNAYDVNVSPDKRTILLHDATALIESLKEALNNLFQNAEQTVPQTTLPGPRSQSIIEQHMKLPEQGPNSKTVQEATNSGSEPSASTDDGSQTSVVEEPSSEPHHLHDSTQSSVEQFSEVPQDGDVPPATQEDVDMEDEHATGTVEPQISSSQPSVDEPEEPIPAVVASSQNEKPNVIQNAFDRMRFRRQPAEVSITVGDRTVTSVVGSGSSKKRSFQTTGSAKERQTKRRIHTPSRRSTFSLRAFAAPGSQREEQSDAAEGESESEKEEPMESTEESDVEDEEVERAEEECEETHEEDPEEQGAFHEEYIDEAAKKAQDEAKVQELIREAEETTLPPESQETRARNLTKGQTGRRESTTHLAAKLNGSISRIQRQMQAIETGLQSYRQRPRKREQLQGKTGEERLTLTVNKGDFSRMRIAGQFNLGFILATRPGDDSSGDELFIIDQHASDEKYNFERLQAETELQHQRLVQPRTLELTAVEEEIVIENLRIFEKNGFRISVDNSGEEPIGRRCKLTALPVSREVVFDTRDLEELIAMLGESPPSATSDFIPRPSKVRRLFAMRACRSSTMIGKTLTTTQMERIVRHMGTIDKPWNCPHGRPTMRHLMTLDEWDENKCNETTINLT